jgi:hypothetical protein
MIASSIGAGHDISCPYQENRRGRTIEAARVSLAKDLRLARSAAADPYETSARERPVVNRRSASSITPRQNAQTPDQPRRRHANAPSNEPAAPPAK